MVAAVLGGFAEQRYRGCSAGLRRAHFAVDAYCVEKSFDDTDLGVGRSYPCEIQSVGWSPT